MRATARFIPPVCRCVHLMSPRDLPIYELEAAVVAAMRSGARLIVQAPTGSGKSTQIPQMLLRHGLLGDGQVVVLQPRRLATRLLAKRVAEEVGAPLGRDGRLPDPARVPRERARRASASSPRGSCCGRCRSTRAARGQRDHLRRVPRAAPLRRHHARAGAAAPAAGRPDLRIVVMSATLDAGALRGLPGALRRCWNRRAARFPCTIEYLPKAVDFEHEPVWEVAARECARVAGADAGRPAGLHARRLRDQPDGAGDPGRARRCATCLVLPLHGELPPEAQDRAVARYDTRKIIVSTNVAETSLTIDGVTAVVDSGLARQRALRSPPRHQHAPDREDQRGQRRPAGRPRRPHGAGRVRAALDRAGARPGARRRSCPRSSGSISPRWC